MNNLLDFYQNLCDAVDALHFSWPVEFVYNPLRYAWNGFTQYNEMYSNGHKRVVFLGMNPGPWGMAQTGVPFGEINAVRNFLRIDSISITHPDNESIKYPVLGLECRKSEVSGKRLWGLFSQRFGTADSFFREHFVLNYCPLLFIARNDKGGFRNYTPDRIRQDESALLFELCDMCLIKAIEILSPHYVVGIGNFAYKQARKALIGMNVNVSKILHPSPASPSANKGWAEKAEHQLKESGVWNEL
ncbi:MAG: hypothetical protein IJS42_03135 [Synergistaceae bacterium]|nr:hypothetical protein [Synergistaceae bacterium]